MSKFTPKISVIVTVLNEAKTIAVLLNSLVQQSLVPSEIIVVDGGSRDDTLKIAQQIEKEHPQVNFIITQKEGNRSVGRNYAISLAAHELLACTDAGCIPKNDWLEQLFFRYKESNDPVIAGYYAGVAKTDFEQAVIPYALVMPDAVNPDTFLPATRSLFLEKTVWEKLQGFAENLRDNEDYEFAKRIQKANIPISFARNAIVYWQPRTSIQEFYWMIFRFARGDIYAGIVRPKVIFIFVRYFCGIALIISSATVISVLSSLYAALIIGALYALWAISKNKKYVATGWYWLPVLQVLADAAVMQGSVAGFLKKIRTLRA